MELKPQARKWRKFEALVQKNINDTTPARNAGVEMELLRKSMFSLFWFFFFLIDS